MDIFLCNMLRSSVHFLLLGGLSGVDIGWQALHVIVRSLLDDMETFFNSMRLFAPSACLDFEDVFYLRLMFYKFL